MKCHLPRWWVFCCLSSTDQVWFIRDHRNTDVYTEHQQARRPRESASESESESDTAVEPGKRTISSVTSHMILTFQRAWRYEIVDVSSGFYFCVMTWQLQKYALCNLQYYLVLAKFTPSVWISPEVSCPLFYLPFGLCSSFTMCFTKTLFHIDLKKNYNQFVSA